MAKFIDLRSDFGFKYCMTDEIIMKSFLNAVLMDDADPIVGVKFENVELIGSQKGRRGVAFDLHCTTDKGDTILIEMQNSCQKYFKTRAFYYVLKLMEKQIGKGLAWDKMERDIDRIIGIFIMGEKMPGIKKVVTKVAMCDAHQGGLFWPQNLNYFLSLPHFSLDIDNMNMRDIWLDFFKNLGNMENIDPSVYNRADEGLLRLIEKAKVGALSDREYLVYEASMKNLADEIDLDAHGYARGKMEGREEGREEGIMQGIATSVRMMAEGKMTTSEIAKLLHIPEEEIKAMLS